MIDFLDCICLPDGGEDERVGVPVGSQL